MISHGDTPADANAFKSITFSGSAVNFHSETTALGTYSSGETPCNFYFADGTNQDVAAGRVWITFDCPEVTSETSRCELGDSYVIFENCTGAEEEE